MLDSFKVWSQIGFVNQNVNSEEPWEKSTEN
jgi:hypothetical protein